MSIENAVELAEMSVSDDSHVRKGTSDPAILVVEDEALILWDIAEELRAAGYVVYEALHADAAITLLEKHKNIAAIFTDIDMPGSMNGLVLSNLVRDRWPPVKIVITSGKIMFGSAGLPPGGVFVSKPYHPSMVISTLRNLLN